MRVSCTKGTGVQSARTAILRAIASLDSTGNALPKTYGYVKSFFEAQNGSALSSSIPARSPPISSLRPSSADDVYDSFRHWFHSLNAKTLSGKDLVMTREDFFKVVTFWHDIGLIYFHAGTKLLFRDPRMVLELVRSIVVHKEMILTKADSSLTPRQHRDLLGALATEAILDRELLEKHLWKTNPFFSQQDQWPGLICVLEDFGVIMALNEPPVDKWLVPSLIPEGLPRRSVQRLSPTLGLLVRRYAMPFVPFGFLLRLHIEVERIDEDAQNVFGAEWGYFDLHGSSAMYSLDGADVFPEDQFRREAVGRHALVKEEARVTLTAVANSEVGLRLILRAVEAILREFPGLPDLCTQLIPTPLGTRGNSVGSQSIHAVVPGNDPALYHGAVATRSFKTYPFPGFGNKVFQFSDLERRPPSQIFISYEWGVQDQVRALKTFIEEDLHYSCWIDLEKLKTGHNIEQECLDGIKGADLVVICVTETYLLSSPNAFFEYQTAVETDKKILVIMMEDLPDKKVIEATESDARRYDAKRKAKWDKARAWREDKPDKLEALSSILSRFYVWGVDECTLAEPATDGGAREGTWSTTFSAKLKEGISNAFKPRSKTNAGIVKHSAGEASTASSKPKPLPTETRTKGGACGASSGACRVM